MGLVTFLKNLGLLRREPMRRALMAWHERAEAICRAQASCPGLIIDPSVVLVGYREGALSAGEGVRVEAGSVLAFGEQGDAQARIEIGERSWIGQYNNLRVGGGLIRIGRDCLVSQFCTLVAANHGVGREGLIRELPHDASRLGVTLGDDVWLGAGVVLLPGVEIGTGAVIGANSVVNESVPPYEIWAGVPARKIGQRQ